MKYNLSEFKVPRQKSGRAARGTIHMAVSSTQGHLSLEARRFFIKCNALSVIWLVNNDGIVCARVEKYKENPKEGFNYGKCVPLSIREYMKDFGLKGKRYIIFGEEDEGHEAIFFDLKKAIER